MWTYYMTFQLFDRMPILPHGYLFFKHIYDVQGKDVPEFGNDYWHSIWPCNGTDVWPYLELFPELGNITAWPHDYLTIWPIFRARRPWVRECGRTIWPCNSTRTWLTTAGDGLAGQNVFASTFFVRPYVCLSVTVRFLGLILEIILNKKKIVYCFKATLFFGNFKGRSVGWIIIIEDI